MRQIILDTETTGLLTTEGHRIIEIGCIELVNRQLTGNRFHHYLNPERLIDEEALAVHGITNAFLQDKPVFSSIAKELIDFMRGAELIIHNAPFDVGFINYELQLLQGKWQPLTHYCRIVDTLVLARQLHVGQRNSLDALCKRYSIDNTRREFHGALLDAHLLAQVYLAMTGGQGSLFDQLQAAEIAIENSQPVVTPLKKHTSRVIKANPEELALHEQYLSKIREKGECLWDTLCSL